MSIYEIVIIGVALAMDAFAVSVADGISEPRMRMRKQFGIAFAFGGFQFLMPIVGYVCGSAFSFLVEKIAPYLSFALLAFLGGKMIFDYFAETLSRDRAHSIKQPLSPSGRGGLTAGKLSAQAVATSIDALAVGVALLAQEQTGGLPAHFAICALVIGMVTFFISGIAVTLGKKAGGRITDEANLAGGLVLVGIGLKLLLEGIL